MLAHGIIKMQSGLDNIGGWFSSIGIPSFMAYIIAYFEVIGGAALIIGLLTRYVSAAFVIMLLVALFKVKVAIGFTGDGQGAGWELDLALIAIAAYLTIRGSEGWSVDCLFGRARSAKSTN